MDEMRNMLTSINQLENIEKTEGDIKLTITTEGNDAEIRWAKTTNVIDYHAKGVILTFDDGLLESLTDG